MWVRVPLILPIEFELKEKIYIFDWPQEELNFIEEYCNSLDLEKAQWDEKIFFGCKTPRDCLDITHWEFEDTPHKSFANRVAFFDSYDAWDDKLCSLVAEMAHKHIEEFKDRSNLAVERSGSHYYPANDGFMGWHTNCLSPAWRIYLTYTEEGNKSYISYYDEESKEEVRSYDKKGVTCRAFKIETHSKYGKRFVISKDQKGGIGRAVKIGETSPLRHSVFSQTRRWSFGFIIYGDRDET